MSFSYHANTLAFGGQIERSSFRKMLPSQASVTLPPEGGFGESIVSDFADGDVSFYRAESRVFGNSYQNRLFKTYANVTIYGLNIAGVIQADVLSASITSINQRVENCTSESRISFDASMVGLTIDGQPYDVDLDTSPFLQNGTFSEFKESVRRMSQDDAEALCSRYNWPIEECQTPDERGQLQFHVPRRCENGLRATILRDIRPAVAGEKSGLRRQGFTIEVPRLGLVHLGEVMLTTGRRGINLLRVELGKTLDLGFQPVASAQITEEPRPLALAFTSDAISTETGGYTVAHAVGNGTDFGPP